MWGKQECNTVSTLLWDYAANRLFGDEAEMVEAHLQICAACRAQAEEYRQTISLVNAYRQTGVPQSRTSWHDLRHQLEVQERRHTPRWSLRINSLAWAGATTFAAVLLLVATKDQWPLVAPSTNTERIAPAPKHITQPITPGSAKPGTAITPSPTTDEINDPEGQLYPDEEEIDGIDAMDSGTPTPSVKQAAVRPGSYHTRSTSGPTHIASVSHPAISNEWTRSDDSAAVGQPPRDYVLPPASTEEDDPHHYVIDTIGPSPRTTTEDSRTW